MTVRHLINASAKHYNLAAKNLLNASLHEYSTLRKELCYLAIQSGFNFSDMERETGISKTAWRKALLTYSPECEYASNPIIPIAKELEQEEEKAKREAEAKRRKKKALAATKKERKVSLGFQFTPLEELLMEKHIDASIEFMQNYGKGMTFQRSYGRIIRKRSQWIVNQ
jgi:hypothetical protein